MSRKTPTEYLEVMRKIAQDNGGKLLDAEWKGSTAKYWFIDSNNRKFSRSYTTIQRRGWIKLFIFSKDKYLEEIKEIAKSRSGRLLSTEYRGRNYPLKFIDKDGIEFFCSPRKIRNGGWLSNRFLVSEPICRQTLEFIFGYSFPKNKSILNRKITNRIAALELDGYCKELNIAFEYQGHRSHWDENNNDYLQVRERDLEKEKFCNKLNIILIQIPRFKEGSNKWDSKTVLKIILNLVNEKLKNNKDRIPNIKTEDFSIDFSSINQLKNNINALKIIAKKHGGELLSQEWHGVTHFYDFKSKDGILFSMSLKNYRANGWPGDIDKYQKLRNGHKKTDEELLNEISNMAINNNCILLSDKWKGNYSQYSFQAKNGEVFWITAQNVKRSSWSKKYSQ